MNIFAKPGTSFQADGLEREQAMNDHNDQISVLLKIHQHDDKMSRANNDVDYYNSQSLEGTYYKMTPLVLESVLDEIEDHCILEATEIDLDQDSVCTQICRHADKLVARFDNKYRGIMDETYYLMPATNWVVRDAILINNKPSA